MKITKSMFPLAFIFCVSTVVAQSLSKASTLPLAIGNVWENGGDCPSKVYFEKDTLVSARQIKVYKRVTESACNKTLVEYFSKEANGIVKYTKEDGFATPVLYMPSSYKLADTLRSPESITIVRELNSTVTTMAGDYRNVVKLETTNKKDRTLSYTYIDPQLGLVAVADKGGIISSYLKKYTVK